MEATIYWTTALLALVGVVLNIKKHVSCFAIWTVTNATWAIVDYMHGIYPQAALQLVYFALSVYGLLSWSRCRQVKGTKCHATGGGLVS